MQAKIDVETLNAIHNIMIEHNVMPVLDEKLAREGYSNIMIGVAPPTLFGHTITLVLDDGEARPVR